MRISRHALAGVAVLTLSAQVASAAQPRMLLPDARERVPAALIGMWKVDKAASTPDPSAAAVQLRSFQYTADGKILVNFFNLHADGRQVIGHWALQVDGTPGYEYRSDNGSTPISELHVKMPDPSTLSLTNSVAGKLASSAVYKLSDDGQTLTLTRDPDSKSPVIIVYRKWNGR